MARSNYAITPEHARRLFKAVADDLAFAHLNNFIGNENTRAMLTMADHGYVSCAHELMSNYLYGLNGAVVSKERFTYWASKAASYGSASAAEALTQLDHWPNVAPKENG